MQKCVTTFFIGKNICFVMSTYTRPITTTNNVKIFFLNEVPKVFYYYKKGNILGTFGKVKTSLSYCKLDCYNKTILNKNKRRNYVTRSSGHLAL